MIAFLRGKILKKGENFIILDVNNVGYKIYISSAVFAEIETGEQLELFIYHYVREDNMSLYGFRSSGELEMFELLLSISGIGPKSALGVLSIASLDDIKQSISDGDAGLLTKVSGIGKKTAERIVLELREKISHIDGSKGVKHTHGGGDEIDALMALGYSMVQARDALSQVDSNIKDSGDRIRQALKKLGK